MLSALSLASPLSWLQSFHHPFLPSRLCHLTSHSFLPLNGKDLYTSLDFRRWDLLRKHGSPNTQPVSLFSPLPCHLTDTRREFTPDQHLVRVRVQRMSWWTRRRFPGCVEFQSWQILAIQPGKVGPADTRTLAKPKRALRLHQQCSPNVGWPTPPWASLYPLIHVK